jgi:hypothetical protein
MEICYALVFMDDQNFDLQLQALAAAEFGEVFADHVSGMPTRGLSLRSLHR